MARPKLESAEFPSGLHKKKAATVDDPAKIKGTNITAGDKVKVTGHKGKKPTVWAGSVKRVDPGPVAIVENLHATDEEVPRESEKDKGMEDVSVTVTNGPDESQPVITKDVPTIST